MARYRAFAGLTIAVLLAFIALARLTAGSVATDDDSAHDESTGDGPDGDVPNSTADTRATPENHGEWDDGPERASRRPPEPVPLDAIPTRVLFANVALTQGFFGAAVLGAALMTGVPIDDLGLGPGTIGTDALVAGLGLGGVLAVGNELSKRVAERLGIESDESLREGLTPESWVGWVLLLGVVLPVVAASEELLFRSAVVGVFAAGFGLSPWLLAVVSSVAFGYGHGLQGPGGVVVAGLMGFVLAAAFVLTGSLVTVVLAHYVVNAAEFIAHS